MKASQKFGFLGCNSEPVSSELFVLTDSLSMDIRFFSHVFNINPNRKRDGLLYTFFKLITQAWCFY